MRENKAIIQNSLELISDIKNYLQHLYGKRQYDSLEELKKEISKVRSTIFKVQNINELIGNESLKIEIQSVHSLINAIEVDKCLNREITIDEKLAAYLKNESRIYKNRTAAPKMQLNFEDHEELIGDELLLKAMESGCIP